MTSLDLFGSAAKGEFKPDSSDLDFMVYFSGELVPENFAENYFSLMDELRQLFETDIDLLSGRALKNPVIISKINGKDIADIPSLAKAFQAPGSDGLHTIEFADGSPKIIYLDAAISDMVDVELLKRGIPKLSRE